MTMHAKPRGRAKPTDGVRGFTLIETITTLVVVAVLLAIAAPVVSTATDGYARCALRADLGLEASTALERIVTELREIPLRSGGASPDISAVTPASIAWSTGGSLSLSGTTLRLTVPGGTPETIAADVQSFSVQAYDHAGAALAGSLSGSGCDPVRRLRVTITCARGGVSETLRTSAFLRCMSFQASP